jgi:hypothetical protein
MFLTELETVLTTANVGFDMSGGHSIADEKIIAECRAWRDDFKPIFVQEDSEAIGNWPVLADKAKIWMEDAKKIAGGGYKRVLENGPDVRNSESDSENSDHGEILTNESMYTPEMLDAEGKPNNGGLQRLSNAQVLAWRAPA